MATVNKGEFVLGLQPDDRMPNDYLRMVARVFAAYREIPLEESIVAYIDGLKLTLNNVNGDDVKMDIAAGTAFVDDQFVGFKAPSDITVDGSLMDTNVVYSIVLYYMWINQFPPHEPQFKMVKHVDIDPEHMLELGRLTKRSSTDYELVDDKMPWYIGFFTRVIEEINQGSCRPISRTFYGDGNETTFTVYGYQIGEHSLFVEGVLQNTDIYTLVSTGNNTALTFDTPPNDNEWVKLQFFDCQVVTGDTALFKYLYTNVGDGNTTTFNIPSVFSTAEIYLDGVLVKDTVFDITNNNNTTVIEFDAAPAVDTKISIIYYITQITGNGVTDTNNVRQYSVFNGDGATTAYTIINKILATDCDIYIDGVLENSDNFTTTNDGTDTTITFDNAPANNTEIYAWYEVNESTGLIQTDTIMHLNQRNFTGDGNTTDFICSTVIFDLAKIFIDGILLSNVYFTITDDGTDTKISFDNAPANNKRIKINYLV